MGLGPARIGAAGRKDRDSAFRTIVSGSDLGRPSGGKGIVPINSKIGRSNFCRFQFDLPI